MRNDPLKFPRLPFLAGRSAWLFGTASSRLASVLACLGLGLSAALLGALVWQWSSLQHQLLQKQQGLAIARQALGINASARVAQSATPVMKAGEAVRANQVIRRLNTPWPALLGALERASTPEVALLSIEPDIERGAIRVQTEGQALDPLLGHVQLVQQDKHFAHVQLLRIETDQSAGMAAPRLSFDVVLAR